MCALNGTFQCVPNIPPTIGLRHADLKRQKLNGKPIDKLLTRLIDTSIEGRWNTHPAKGYECGLLIHCYSANFLPI